LAIVTLPLPIQLINGQVADGGQVQTDLNAIASNVNANAAKNGVNNDITSLTALTSVVSGLSITGASLLNCSFASGSIVGTTIDSTSTGVTQAPGTSTTQLATTAFVVAQAFSGVLPALAAPTGASLIGNNPSGGVTGTTVQAAINQIANAPTGIQSFIVNGDMAIDQEHGGSATTQAANGAIAYPVDQWAMTNTRTNGTTLVGQQIASPLTGYRNALRITNTTAGASVAADNITVSQPVEGINLANLSWGTASAQSIRVNFIASSTVAGNYAIALRNAAANRSYCHLVALTSTPTRFSFVIVGDTSGTWTTAASVGLFFGFDLGSGSTFQTSTLDAWQAGNFFAATTGTKVSGTGGAQLTITGVDIRPGTLDKPFEQMPIPVQLIECQRYFQFIKGQLAGFTSAGTANSYNASLPVQMRPTPVSTFVDGAINTNCTSSVVTVIDSGTYQFSCTGSSSAGFIGAARHSFNSRML